MMDFDVITAKADKNEIERIKLIIDRLKEKNPTLIVTPLKFGKIGDDIIVTFKVDIKNYRTLLEKLVVNNVKLLSRDLKSQQIIDNAKASINTATIKGNKGWEDIKDKNLLGDHKRLQDFINEGNYSEVIRISRTIALGRDAVESAKNNIDRAIERAINIAFTEGLSKKYDVEKNIQRLVQIASDNNLKLLQKIDQMKQAGLNAIQLCAQNKNNVGELIGICNNSSLNNLINIKASIKFAEIVLIDPESFQEDIQIAIKTLNTRWLQIALNVVINDLQESEIILFNKLMDFINQRR